MGLAVLNMMLRYNQKRKLGSNEHALSKCFDVVRPF